ncbi:glutamine ABC transporter ATP-binding protein [Gallibacterium salpingitidis]|uniref:Glutamine ABC transporter ATP-binding protein n=1 Tax=Gallibacterium salpingitidis TaxID=505341 RepID=A0AB36E629_9PAST|nr:ABC transporter ATP-binding protein [Gallibacterium salpingitidis]OBX05157.1 glutamine ABC transporter ATP-binding protein [Gallibacterium salpingitidis]OBX10178.1 glutamine ABC transporter ATP-binding protein [Gallibacterium salpingitidis]WKS99623.1 ABC transporter ATP-binding protein [Gallibacterium salpingitidis]
MPIILAAENVVFQEKIHYPNLTIPEGKATFLQGPSGCGKSTLLHLFNATLPLTQGQILYRNKNIQHLDKIQLRREILLASQQLYLFSGSILENFRQYHQYRESVLPPTSELEHYLALCLVPFSLEQQIDKLSGGEKQRVFLAIALSLKPTILMLDEPTSALDANTANQVMQNLKNHCLSKTTLIVISHDQALTQHYADHIVYLHKEERNE